MLVPILKWIYPDVTAAEVREARGLGPDYMRPKKRKGYRAVHPAPPVYLADIIARRNAQASTSTAKANESIDVDMAGLSTSGSNDGAGNSLEARSSKATDLDSRNLHTDTVDASLDCPPPPYVR